jgi:hypothetical protein
MFPRSKSTFLLLVLFCTPLFILAHQNDTLFCHLTPGDDTLYTDTAGGYTLGVNAQGDRAVAQKYGISSTEDSCNAPDSSTLTEVLIGLGAKQIVNPADSLKINVYEVKSDGSPGAQLSESFAVKTDQADTSSSSLAYTRFLLKTPVTLTDSFFVSVNFILAGDDTLGLRSNKDGAGNSRLAWIKTNSGSWKIVQQAKGLAINPAIFPVIEVEGGHHNSVPDVSSNLVRSLRLYPVPATHTLNMELQLKGNLTAKSLELQLTSAQGELIATKNIATPKASQQIHWDTSHLPQGLYFLTLKDSKTRLSTRKFLLIKD